MKKLLLLPFLWISALCLAQSTPPNPAPPAFQPYLQPGQSAKDVPDSTSPEWQEQMRNPQQSRGPISMTPLSRPRPKPLPNDSLQNNKDDDGLPPPHPGQPHPEIPFLTVKEGLAALNDSNLPSYLDQSNWRIFEDKNHKVLWYAPSVDSGFSQILLRRQFSPGAGTQLQISSSMLCEAPQPTCENFAAYIRLTDSSLQQGK